jgi:hypothetical protein
MKWLKNVLVDITVSVVIIIAVVVNLEWLKIVVIAYTALMLLLKIIALVNDQFMKSVKPGKSAQVPLWFISSLYALNVFVLIGFAWYLTAVQWALIWLFSWLAYSKNQKQKVQKRFQ